MIGGGSVSAKRGHFADSLCTGGRPVEGKIGSLSAKFSKPLDSPHSVQSFLGQQICGFANCQVRNPLPEAGPMAKWFSKVESRHPSQLGQSLAFRWQNSRQARKHGAEFAAMRGT